MKRVHNTALFRVTALCGAILLLVIDCSRLPNQDITINPPPEALREREIPSQPGIDGIIITGPRQLLPVFRILPLRSGRVIDFSYFSNNVNIEVTARVDSDGHLVIESMNDAGFPEASDYIRSAMSGWTYTNYKTGRIKFWFDLASKGRRLKIDKSGLRINRAATSVNTVPDGNIHLIEGLRPGDLGYVNF
ncbi:hypothetical protein JXO52_14085 [bacterium]|nr:hypothetical protein [bacterium]